MKKELTVFLFSIFSFLFPNLSHAQIIAGGATHSIGICIDSTIKSWGRNNMGQLGTGNYTDSYVPTSVNSSLGFIAVAAGYEHTLGLKIDGTVWAWGKNADGQCANGGGDTPIQINNL